MDRRAFLATSGLAAIAPWTSFTRDPSRPPEIPTQIRPREIAQLKSMADVIHRLDNEYGGGGVGARTRPRRHDVGRLLAAGALPRNPCGPNSSPL